MDGGRQSQPVQQGAAVGMVSIPGEGGDNLLRGPLLEFPHETDGSCGGFGFDQ